MSTAGRSDGRPTVGHFVRVYFRLSQNWIPTQIRHLSEHRPVVFTEETANLEGVPASDRPEIVSLRERGRLVHLVNKAVRSLLGFYPSFGAPAERHGLDLVHAHFGPMGWQVRSVARRLGVPLVVRFYGQDVARLPSVQPRWRRRYRTLFEEADRFLVEGPAMGEQLIELGCPAEKIEVQALGIPLAAYPEARRFRVPGQPLRILMVGRFREKKGFPHGLRAVARLRDEGRAVVCTLVGGPGSSPRGRREGERIRRVIEEEELEETVRRPGRVSHARLRRLYYEHHVLLVPSVTARSGDNEGGAPVTAIEAAATGMPVVATRHRDLPEVVDPEVSGLLVPERDPAAAARALARLDEEPELLARMGAAGRRRVEERFEAGRQARRLEATYRELLAEGTAGSPARAHQHGKEGPPPA